MLAPLPLGGALIAGLVLLADCSQALECVAGAERLLTTHDVRRSQYQNLCDAALWYRKGLVHMRAARETPTSCQFQLLFIQLRIGPCCSIVVSFRCLQISAAWFRKRLRKVVYLTSCFVV